MDEFDGTERQEATADLQGENDPAEAGQAECRERVASTEQAESWYPGKGSTGPKTAEGKARVARNALKHGLRAQKFVFADEDADAFQEFRIELMNELAPLGTMETALANRIAQSMWRLGRIMPMEAEMMDAQREKPNGELCPAGEVFARPSFGGPRGVAVLSRYETALDRGLHRALRELRARQAERVAEGEVLPARLPYRLPGMAGAGPQPVHTSRGLTGHPLQEERVTAPHPGLASPGLTGRPLPRGEGGGLPLPVAERQTGETPAQWAVRTMPREVVEAMIRDGVNLPVSAESPVQEDTLDRQRQEFDGTASTPEASKAGNDGGGGRTEAFDSASDSEARGEISKQSPRKYAASGVPLGGTG